MTVLASVSNTLVTLALLPGIVAHEGAHYLACRLLGVRVTAVHADPVADAVGIDHEPVESFPADLAVAFAPLLVNTVLSVASFAALAGVPVGTPLLGWVGVTAAFTAIPSHVDTETFLRTARAAEGATRLASLAVAWPLRSLTAVPWVAGVYGVVWVYVCLGLGL